MIASTPNKSAISVAEMARMVGLSRSRFYQLIGSTFPFPIYNVETRRPFYPQELQEQCVEVRRRNCGIDGKSILFYSRQPGSGAPRPKPRKSKVPVASGSSRHADVLDGIRALGMATATAAQVEQAVRELFPAGSAEVDQTEVIRAVFVHLMRRNSADNLGG